MNKKLFIEHGIKYTNGKLTPTNFYNEINNIFKY